MEFLSEYSLVIEIIGAVLSLFYLYFSIRKSIWLWPLGLLASSFYIAVYFYSKLYAEMGLQVYYIIVSIYGWYFWMFGNKTNSNQAELPISRLNLKATLIYLGAFIFLYLGLYLILSHFTDSNIPGWDSLATALSLVATWMLARKVLENWIIWIIADAMCIAISIYKDLYFTAALFVVYTIMAFAGYLSWKKSIK